MRLIKLTNRHYYKYNKNKRYRDPNINFKIKGSVNKDLRL